MRSAVLSRSLLRRRARRGIVRLVDTTLARVRRALPARRRSKAALVIGGLLASAVGLVRHGELAPPPGPYDAIIVAGCRVAPNGRPGRALARRTRLAVRLYQRGYARRVVFTGGVGDYGESEAKVASRYAMRLGLPRAAVVREERSTSTAENARFAAEIIGRDQRVLVVTDAYHVFRARRVFARYFRQAEGAGAAAARRSWVRAVPRELIAVAIYAVRGDLVLLPRRRG